MSDTNQSQRNKEAAPWTEQEISDLKGYWRLGMSTSEIAKKLGTRSTSAVAGKIKLIRAKKSADEKPAVRRESALGRLW